MRFVRLLWITKRPGRAWVGSVPNKHNPSTKLGLSACISSRITTVIHVMNDHQINDNCFNEPFAVSPCKSLYWDMHGLIFETSIWLLAGSTRLIRHCREWLLRAQRTKRNSNQTSFVTLIITKAYHDSVKLHPIETNTWTPREEWDRSVRTAVYIQRRSD